MRKCSHCGYSVEVGYIAQDEFYCDWCIIHKIEEMEKEIKRLTINENEDEEEPLNEMVM